MNSYKLGSLRAKRAFTLVEVLLVVFVIGILGTIIITRVIGASRKSKETALRADLYQLRYAIEYFEAHTSAYPPRLSDIMASDPEALSGSEDGRGRIIDPAEYKGPYLITEDGRLPEDPITGAADWYYNNRTGNVRSNSTLTALDGSRYITW